MVPTARNVDRAHVQCLDDLRENVPFRVAVPQHGRDRPAARVFVASAERQYVPIAPQRESVLPAPRKRHKRAAHTLDVERQWLVGRRAVATLALVVLAPREASAVTGNGE